MIEQDNVKLISFSKVLAMQYSVREAAVLQYLAYVISKDRTFQGIEEEGKRWFYHTEDQLLEALPFCKNVRTVVDKLVKKGVLLKKHFPYTHNVCYYTFNNEEVLKEALLNKIYFDVEIAKKFGQCGENVAIVYAWFVQVIKMRQLKNKKDTSAYASPGYIAQDLPFLAKMTIWRAIGALIEGKYIQRIGSARDPRYCLAGQQSEENAVPNKADIVPIYTGTALNVIGTNQSNCGHKKNNAITDYAYSITNDAMRLYSSNKSSMETKVEFRYGDKRPRFAEDGSAGPSNLSCAAARAENDKIDTDVKSNAPRPLLIPTSSLTDEVLKAEPNEDVLDVTLKNFAPLKNNYTTSVCGNSLLTNLFYNLLSYDFKNEHIKNYPLNYVSKYLGKLMQEDCYFDYTGILPKNEKSNRCATLILEAIHTFNLYGIAYELTETDIRVAANFLHHYPKISTEAIMVVLQFILAEHQDFHKDYPEKPIGEDYDICASYPKLKLQLKAHQCVTLQYLFNYFGYFLYRAVQVEHPDCLDDLNVRAFYEPLNSVEPDFAVILNDVFDSVQKVANEFGPLAVRFEICVDYRNELISASSLLSPLRKTQNVDECATWQLNDENIGQSLSLDFFVWAQKVILAVNPQLLPDHTNMLARG
jgi:hypothetical protein